MSPTFRALHNPNYRRYALGSLVSNTGTWMQRVAQDWLVLRLTDGSGTALGITTGLQFLPVLLLSPYAGVIADRFPKRRLLQLTQLTMAFASLVLGVLAVTGGAQVWQVYVIAFLFGIGSAFDAPARQSFVSEMVGPDDLTNAVGLNSATFNTARIIGPALAGLMIGALGGGATATGWVILINALSYGAVIWQLEHMDTALLHSPEAGRPYAGDAARGRPLRPQPAEDDDDPGDGVLRRHLRHELPDHLRADGHRGLRQGRRRVRHPRLGDGGRLARRRADGGPPGPDPAALLVAGAALGFGAAEIVAGLMPTYVAFALMCPVIGLCTLTMLNSANATMQLESEPALRGRVMALYMTIVMGGTPIGSPIIGWVGQHVRAALDPARRRCPRDLRGRRWRSRSSARPSRAAAEAERAVQPTRRSSGGRARGRADPRAGSRDRRRAAVSRFGPRRARE